MPTKNNRYISHCNLSFLRNKLGLENGGPWGGGVDGREKFGVDPSSLESIEGVALLKPDSKDLSASEDSNNALDD
jgi:hypothetical protein